MLKRGFLAVLFASGLAYGEDPPPPPPERVGVEVKDPALKAAIEDCIRRGVNWLKAQQKPDGSWPGLDRTPMQYPSGRPYLYQPELSALALLALLKCGVPAQDPGIAKGLAWLKKQDFKGSGGYGSAVALMVLEAKCVPEKDDPDPSKPLHLGENDRDWAVGLANHLLAIQSKPGGWRYWFNPPDGEKGKPAPGDVSCTQYALMGLHTARRMGIPVKGEVFVHAAEFLLGQQEADGPAAKSARARGWPYLQGNLNPERAKASGAMTCAGLCGVLICRDACLQDRSMEKAKKEKFMARLDQAIYDGLAWLDAHWSVTENPPLKTEELGYYLYGLERSGMMAGLRRIGAHDWYEEGARFLTSKIAKDGADKGSWSVGMTYPKTESQETPYALLFLRKASIRVAYPVGEAPKEP